MPPHLHFEAEQLGVSADNEDGHCLYMLNTRGFKNRRYFVYLD
jgi:hypothetical protein